MDFGNRIMQPPSKSENANFLSKMCFWWVTQIVKTGYRRDLELDDIPLAMKVDTSAYLNEKLEKEWNKELEKSNTKNQGDVKPSKKYSPSFLKALSRTFYLQFCTLGIFTFIEECGIKIFQPFCISKLVLYFNKDTSSKENEGVYFYAVGLVASTLVYTIIHHPYFFALTRLGMKMRISCTALIYRKALKLSQASLGKNSVGKIINILSNDANRFDLSVLFMHFIWCGPIQLIMVMAITYTKIGFSTTVGGLFLILCVPLQSWIGKVFSTLRFIIAGRTDKRIRLMNEIVDGIKVIKMYAWENPFVEIVKEARRMETKAIRKVFNYKSFNMGFFFSSSRVVMAMILVVFILTGEEINAEKVFLTFGFYNAVRLSMTLFFPNAIGMVSETLVSIQRIEDFLKLEENTGNRKLIHHDICPPSDEKTGLKLEKVSGRWDASKDEHSLQSIDLTVGHKEFCAIIGPVGSGKSTILQSILGEFPVTSGNISIKGKVSYASQEAWIFVGTIRQNIVMGKSFFEKRYKEVIRVCALQHDIDSWEDGDYTLVGEKGVSLSGGQKARINLARCIYDDSDIYLLDDPLSAVDSHVSKHLLDECIKGFLHNKAVILVTHQLQHLSKADNIVILNAEGSIQIQGTFSEIMASGAQITSFIEQENEPEDQVPFDNEQSLDPTFAQLTRDPMFSCSRSTSVVSLESIFAAGSGASLRVFNEKDENTENALKKLKTKSERLKETTQTGNISAGIYAKYITSGSNALNIIILLLFPVLTQSLLTSSDIWLGIWVNSADYRQNSKTNNDSIFQKIIEENNIKFLDIAFNANPVDLLYCGIYVTIVLCLAISVMIQILHFSRSLLNSSRNLHNNMFSKLVGASSRFFDINPTGRILNRFSKDMGTIDELLPAVIMDIVLIFGSAIGIFFVSAYNQPITLVPMMIIMIVAFTLRRFFIRASRSVKRLEGVAKSPIFSKTTSTIQGITTIRAIKAEEMMIEEFDNIQDTHTSTHFIFIALARWFGLYLDYVVTAFITCVVFTFVFIDTGVRGGDVGITLTACITLSGMIQWGMRQTAEMESMMVSVERVAEYGKLPQEETMNPKELVVDLENVKTEKKWPTLGIVDFKSLKLKYDQNDPYVLKGLSFRTRPFEKIGIIGRTGAGKSSIITALFRLVEPEGGITIDNMNILSMPLKKVRSHISIIPQDPILFSGSLRRNMDPFNKYGDKEVWNALEQANLSEVVSDLPNGINSKVNEGGSNFSVGQRQLICLARAILRGNKILVMDEATANVDAHTDSIIQKAIRTKFEMCTVFTIAHRLHTVMDSDRILVLHDGLVKEFGEPHELLKNSESMISKMVNDTGPSMAKKLKAMAEGHFELMHHQKASSHL